MAKILHISVGGAKKTHIMYKCNLNYYQLQGYLKALSDRKLLKKAFLEDSNKSYYETTSKGHLFLEAYRNIKVLLST